MFSLILKLPVRVSLLALVSRLPTGFGGTLLESQGQPLSHFLLHFLPFQLAIQAALSLFSRRVRTSLLVSSCIG